MQRPTTIVAAMASMVPFFSSVSSQIFRASISISTVPAQTFHGIGGSGAWWPYDMQYFPVEQQQNISRLLFSEEGLGLTSYRWNIGSGGVNVTTIGRGIETFYVSDGVYDWTKDAPGMYFLKAANDYKVPHLTAFANSAPAVMTSGGASCNGSFVNGTGLRYGRYLADVLDHLINVEGINISLVSPINEPDNNFGPSPCSQEGMECDANQRAEVINSLYQALTEKDLEIKVGIIMDESSSLSRAKAEYSAWLPEVMDKVHALAHHVYEFPNDTTYLAYKKNVSDAYPGVETWMSEICCSMGLANGTGRGWSGGFDPTIQSGLLWATMAFQSLAVAKEPHYDFWTLLSGGMGCSPFKNDTCMTLPNEEGWTDGVIYWDPDYAVNGNYELYLPKHFFTYKHFGNFIKPGYVNYPVPGITDNNQTLAVSTGDGWNILSMNPTTTTTYISLTFPEPVCAQHSFATSELVDWAQIKGSAVTIWGNLEWQLELGEMSMNTFIFSSGAC